MSKINPWAKVGLVIGGYVMACLVAGGAVYVNGLLTPDAVKQASSGMFLIVRLLPRFTLFPFSALFPTGLALYFLIAGFLSRKQKPTSA